MREVSAIAADASMVDELDGAGLPANKRVCRISQSRARGRSVVLWPEPLTAAYWRSMITMRPPETQLASRECCRTPPKRCVL